MTRTVDSWIIETIFEPIAHRVEAWTGVNNFTLSRFSLTGWLAAAGVNAIQSPGPFYYTLLGIAILVCAANAWIATMHEKLAKRAGTAPPARHDRASILFRYFWLGFVASDFVVAFTGSGWHRLLGSVGLGAHMYFLCCSPMPPSYKQQTGHAIC